jgi:hypothetical protein
MNRAPTTDTGRLDEASLEDQPSEHIYIESPEGGNGSREARTVTERFQLNDRARGVVTELTLYAEGFATTTRFPRGRPPQRHRLDLRFLDPAPRVHRRYAMAPLYAAIGLATAALAALTLASAFSGTRLVAIPAGTLAASGALIALLMFVRKWAEDIVFVTAHGRAAVLTLSGGFGCLRRLRALVPLLAGAISEANAGRPQDRAACLREEMREHYRLQNAGIIPRPVCTEATGRILAEFG